MIAMQQRKLFWYFGAKTALIDDIIKLVAPLYSTGRITAFVDVFGGAGNVLLNVPLEWKVNRIYNDIDSRLYNLMLDLKDEKKRNLLFENLFWSLSSKQLFNDFKTKEQNDSFEFLYRIFNSFNGDTYSYRTKITIFRESYSSQLSLLKRNWKYIQNWNNEYLDFENLIKKYDSATTFFYLDTPYLTGGKNYKYIFEIKDFERLKNAINNMKGFYLMNESERDFDAIKKIFGEPNFVKKYVNHVNTNRNQLKSKNRKQYRLEGYWYNF